MIWQRTTRTPKLRVEAARFIKAAPLSISGAGRQPVAAAARIALAVEAEDSADKPPSWGSGLPLEPVALPFSRTNPDHKTFFSILADGPVCLHPCAASLSGDNWFH